MRRCRSGTLIAPVLGLVAVLAGLAKMGTGGTVAAAVILIGSVLAAVHHAEVVAHRVGEPFGTLVLAIAVTVIEVSLIVSLMLSNAGDATTLARDTVFAAIMIILNFIIGLCLLAGAVRHHEQALHLEGYERGTGGARGDGGAVRWCCPSTPRRPRGRPMRRRSWCSSRSSR